MNPIPLYKMLVLTMHDENIYAERVIRAGARGFLMKDEYRSMIVESIRKIISGKIVLSEEMTSTFLEGLMSDHSEKTKNIVEKLTHREMDVFQLVGQGYKTYEIAQQLNISPKTVGTHRYKIKTN